MNKLHITKQFWMILLAVICIIFASCSTSVDSEEQERITQITDALETSISAHDEAMALMSEAGSLQTSILHSTDSLSADTLTVENELKVVEALKNSSDAMMVWMKNFSRPPRTEELEALELTKLDSILQVQTDQLEEINRINQNMKQAVKDGRQLIQKN